MPTQDTGNKNRTCYLRKCHNKAKKYIKCEVEKYPNALSGNQLKIVYFCSVTCLDKGDY